MSAHTPHEGQPQRNRRDGPGLLQRLATEPDDALCTPQEVGDLFRVHPRTVTRWTRAGRLRHTTTIGGQVRIYLGAVRQMLAEQNGEGAPGT